MSSIIPTTPSFVVKNISKKSISVLGRLPITPGNKADLFKSIINLSESEIIDALRAPTGALYKEVFINKNISIISYELLTLNNLIIDYKNLNSVNEAIPGQVLSVDYNNNLKWVFGDMAARLSYQPPIIQNGDSISIPKADAFTNGFLSKEDWVIFKGKSKGLRIWQYQDVSGPFSNPIKLSNFENGKALSFNPNLIVDGTAVAVDISNNNSPPRAISGWKGLFSNKITVSQHVRDTVFLSELPDDTTTVRIYFLIILPDGITVPVNYSPPTDYVRKMRIEYFDAIDIDSGGAKSIFGEKIFNDIIGIKNRVFIGDDIKDSKLSVSGDISCDAIKIRHGAAEGLVLTSNTIGVAEWSQNPAVSSSPPIPYDGRMWIKQPEYCSYIFDANRKKWLTTESFIIDGSKNATACSNTYMNGFDNIPHHINSLVLPYDAVLVGLIATCEAKQSWIAEVHLKNKLVKDCVLHVVNSDYASNINLNINFNEGDKIQLFASGNGISMPSIRAIFKRRA